MNFIKKQLNYYYIIICTAIIFSLNSYAVTKTWTGGADLWNDGNNWSPTGVPANSDDVIVNVADDQAVVINADGECASLDVSNSGMAIVNRSDRTLTVGGDAKVDGSGSELRADLGLFDVGGTVTATNSGQIIIDAASATFKAAKLVTDTGTLNWNFGTLWLTDDLHIKTGSPLQSKTITGNHTLLSSNDFGAGLWFDSSAILTLDGGKIVCQNFLKDSSATLNFYDGELRIDADGGANFEWGKSPLVLNGISQGKNPHLILDGLTLPLLASAAVSIATGANSRASLTVTDYSILSGNADIAVGVGSTADIIVSDNSEWQPTNLVLGSYGAASLIITNNSRLVQCRDFHIAQSFGSTGIVTITDNSSWDSYWVSFIGERGYANISILDNSYMKLDAQSQDPIFGKYSGSEAKITVSDPGSKFEILTTGNPAYIFGDSGSASIIISNGANAHFDEYTEFGRNTSGRGEVIVTGNGSEFQADSDVWFGDEGQAAMQVLDGATCIWDQTKLGEFTHGVGNMLVSGEGSYWDGGGYASIGGEFLVGRYGIGTILVTNGANLKSSGYSRLGYYDGSYGNVTITDTGSLWNVTGDLYIGTSFSASSTGIVTIANGGKIIVNNGVTIGYNSILTGNGGTLQGNVENTYGQVNPGASPGILTIDGNFTQKTGGYINIELAGTALNDYDRLVVTGVSTLAGTLNVTAISGYTPVNGDALQIFSWVGGTAGTFDDVNLPALSTGLEWSTNLLYSNGELHVIPEPFYLSFIIYQLLFIYRKWKS